MKEHQTSTRRLSRRDMLRLGANTVLGFMAFESSFLMTGRKGFIDVLKEIPSEEAVADDGFEQHRQATLAPIMKPFDYASNDESERRFTGWIWYSVGVLGQLLTVIDKLDEYENESN